MSLHQQIADIVGANVSSMQMRTEFESAATDIVALLGPHLELALVVKEVETVLPGYGWLVRADESQGYFANIMSPDYVSIVEQSGGRFVDRSLGKRYPAYAPTPAQALKTAFDAVIAAVKAQAN
ncbi:hypothetical protein CcrC1_gp300 [Caulobacter phage C1]|nr:hypothetical protein CcrC1_gp300 [Caulobacter phage C1]UTU08529.1 hypothetical protein CcrC2_gp301 [Caulobacter phage C2]UTU09045.1 hypothetical protein CcrJ4_gp296 [Caulobacter phage J4]UTU10162.1 hypothetical protein CcrRB23_gp300 [Caulobacter phage RB23]WGN97196.1 hypothetical protein [Bertelyvirus sp.]